MKTLFSYLAPYKLRMALGFCIKAAGTLAELVLPLIMAEMIDVVAPRGDVLALSLWGAGMLACAAVGLGGNVIANRMASAVARDTMDRLRTDLFAATLRLSARQTDEVTVPSLVSRLSSDTYNVHNMIGMMQRLGVRAPILLIGGVTLTFLVDYMLAFILLAAVPVLTVVVILVARRGIRLYDDLQRSVDGMVRKVRDDYAGMRVIRALSRTGYERDSFAKINDGVVRCDRRAGLTMAVTNPLMSAILNLGMAAVIFVGAFRVADGFAMPGDIIAFTSYFTIILNAVISVSRIFVNYSKGSASARRIADILALKEELLPQSGLPAGEQGAVLAFENVTFSYGGAPALKDVSFTLQRGESLGVIGATGSGKSTIAALLLRFYDPQAGRVLVDGRDVRAYEADELRKKFGVVFQNDFLMAASVRENIDFERNIADEELGRAAAFARADGFIAEHGGMESTLTARGANFSGGQKQRLLIARALAGAPDILILDDSSSALDYATDAELRKTLTQRLPSTAIVMIAQRISSVRFADKILVLDEGRVAGFGSDKELMATCAVYRSIYASQHGEGRDA